MPPRTRTLYVPALSRQTRIAPAVSQTADSAVPTRCPAAAGPNLVRVHTDAFGRTVGRRGVPVLTMALLFISALPDTMVVPLLSELFVTRYGVSPAAAHWFMSANLIGAVAALPFLMLLRRRLSPGALLALAAAANALWLSIMYLNIGFTATIGVRALEGMADLIVFAVLFDLAARTGERATRGRRLGLAGTVLMLGLFAGAVIGGALGSGEARSVFLFGAAAMVVVACIAAGGARLLPHEPAQAETPASPVQPAAELPSLRAGALWPPLAMVFSDRAIAGLMTATLPLYFAAVAGHGSMTRGWLIGLPLLMMALLACPAGWLGDRIGHGKLRTAAAVLYAAAIAAVPFAADQGLAAALLTMSLVGCAGAALLSTALAMTAGKRPGASAMGAYRLAGDTGYLLGIALAGTLLAIFGGAAPDGGAFTAVILTFAAVHLGITIVTSCARCPSAA